MVAHPLRCPIFKSEPPPLPSPILLPPLGMTYASLGHVLGAPGKEPIGLSLEGLRGGEKGGLSESSGLCSPLTRLVSRFSRKDADDTDFPGKKARVSEMGGTGATLGLAKLLETQTSGKKTQGCLTSCSLPSSLPHPFPLLREAPTH